MSNIYRSDCFKEFGVDFEPRNNLRGIVQGLPYGFIGPVRVYWYITSSPAKHIVDRRCVASEQATGIHFRKTFKSNTLNH